MLVRPPLGESSFVRIRTEGYTYVDKTAEVAEILTDPSPAILLTRPRRFGKTLLLTTLRAFVEPSEGPDLFAGTAITNDPRAMAHHRRHPVLWLSLKEVKPTTLDGLRRRLARELRRALDLHPEAEALASVRAALDAPSDEALSSALRDATDVLSSRAGVGCVVLIDEYDTPLHAAWRYGYYDDAIALLRPMLSDVLKDNPSLVKGVLTGITRVARDGMFSGLNNLRVASMLDADYPTACGFTEREVVALLAAAGLADRLDDVRGWYDGYAIAGERLYNPWSVLSFLRSPQLGFQTWWVNTGGDELLRSLLASGDPNLHAGITTILDGGSVERPLNHHLVLRDLPDDSDAVWTLLVHAGYLHVVSREVRGLTSWATLAPPNLEVRAAWIALFADTLRRGVESASSVEVLTRALLSGDAATLQAQLQTFALRNLSALDPTGRAPERVWHAFTLGLLAHLVATHRVQSEAEAGHGRADVLVAPRSPGPGAVVEFKRVRPGESASDALDAAMAQIDARRYVDRLIEARATPRFKVAVAFAGREVSVRVVPG